MHRFLLTTLVLAMLLLSACTPAATPVAVATATTQPAATAPAAQPATVVVPAGGKTMQCTLQTLLPTPSAADANRFAPVTEKDWILGSADAKITLLEYSDFQ